MKRIITMSTKELDRAEIFSQIRQKTMSQVRAAEILVISTRQVKRLFKKYKAQGPLGLISQKRGKPGNHRLPEGKKELALALIREHYPDFGPTLAQEKLLEVHKIELSIWTVRTLMITEGLWVEKKIKKKRIYQLRERRSSEGELEQMDGSNHNWFEGRGPKCWFLYCIDDATGKIMAGLFASSEALWPYYSLMRIYLEKHDRPMAFYTDKHGVFRINQEEALRGEGVTQFGRAMKELDIKLIFANSPQAKGRIERSNRTLQDRLVKELRLKKISTIKEANAYIPTFIEKYNRRFAVVPKSPNNAHKPLLEEHNLDRIFSIRKFRELSKNLTFQYNNVIYQIQTDREEYALRKARVTVCEKEDGSVEVLYKGKSLAFTVYHRQEKQGEIVDAKQLNEVIDSLQKLQESKEPKQARKLPHNHPWKRGARKFLFGKAMGL